VPETEISVGPPSADGIHPRGSLKRTLFRLHLNGPQSGREDAALSKLAEAWAKKTWESDETPRTFIQAELEARLGAYRRNARWWRIVQISIWLLITFLGLLVSLLAGFKTGHGITLVAGALIATLTTLTNATHPGKKADGYLTARLALRDVGWDLLNPSAAYAALDDEARYRRFVDDVRAIVKAKRMSTSLGDLP
jgi:hypothetical protein